eukprot:gene8222-9102_t
MILKKVKGKPAPWLSNGVKALMNDRDKLLRRSRRTRKEPDISAYKRKRNEVKIAVKRAKSDYHKKLLKEGANDPKKFWRALKSIYPTKVNEREAMKTLDVDGVKIKDPHVISDAFCSFFTSIVTTLKEKAFPLCNFSWKIPSEMSKKTDQNFIFKVVSRREVEQQLKSVKRNKATGLDDLPPGLIKDSAELISAPLAHLINLSLKTSIFPTDWKAAKVIPTHKSGVHSNPDNYRPISVLPVISKVIEKIIHRQLITYLDKNNLLTKSQFGFRPKLSTEYAVTILLDSIRVNVDKGMYLVFFSPADIVWKILEFKISRALLRVLKEVHRVRMIQNGIALAAKLHPDSWLIIIIIGAVRGSGAKFLMKPLDHIVRGELISSNELLQPHFATKSALLVSALLYSEAFAGFNITRQVMVIFIIACLVLFQVAFIFTSIEDPYLKVEKILSYAFMKLPQELFSKHDKKSKTD